MGSQTMPNNVFSSGIQICAQNNSVRKLLKKVSFGLFWRENCDITSFCTERLHQSLLMMQLFWNIRRLDKNERIRRRLDKNERRLIMVCCENTQKPAQCLKNIQKVVL